MNHHGLARTRSWHIRDTQTEISLIQLPCWIRNQNELETPECVNDETPLLRVYLELHNYY